jgi:hypothetical protein
MSQKLLYFQLSNLTANLVGEKKRFPLCEVSSTWASVNCQNVNIGGLSTNQPWTQLVLSILRQNDDAGNRYPVQNLNLKGLWSFCSAKVTVKKRTSSQKKREEENRVINQQNCLIIKLKKMVPFGMEEFFVLRAVFSIKLNHFLWNLWNSCFPKEVILYFIKDGKNTHGFGYPHGPDLMGPSLGPVLEP